MSFQEFTPPLPPEENATYSSNMQRKQYNHSGNNPPRLHNGLPSYYNRRPFNLDRRRYKKVRCVSCSKEGHIYHECKGPFTSFGVVAIRKDDGFISKGPVRHVVKKKCQMHQQTSPDDILQPESQYNILYLMIQRKDTMGYIDFVRGKYPSVDPALKDCCIKCGTGKTDSQHPQHICPDCMTVMCNMCSPDSDLRSANPGVICKNCMLRQYLLEMTCEERERLATWTFEDIWNYLWLNKGSRCYKEWPEAKKLFDALDIKALLESTVCSWTDAEYGFPKGRLNLREEPFDCAIREFCEETGYTREEFTILSNEPFEENFVGTNGVAYRHVYYIGEINHGIGIPRVDSENIQQAGEVKNAAFFTFEQCMHIIRPYDVAKKQLLQRIHEKYKDRYACA